MKSYYNMIKRLDVVVVIALIILSFLPFVFFGYFQSDAEKKSNDEDSDMVRVAIISSETHEVKRIVLTGNEGIETFDVESSDGGVNTVEVHNDKIRIKSANCGDQVCVYTGYVSKPGETIVCLPNQVIVEIVSMGADEVDAAS